MLLLYHTRFVPYKVNTCTRTYIHAYVHMHTYTRTHIHTYIDTSNRHQIITPRCTWIYARIHSHTHKHTYIYTLTYTYITHICNSPSSISVNISSPRCHVFYNVVNMLDYHIIVQHLPTYESSNVVQCVCVCVCVCGCVCERKRETQTQTQTNTVRLLF